MMTEDENQRYARVMVQRKRLPKPAHPRTLAECSEAHARSRTADQEIAQLREEITALQILLAQYTGGKDR